MAGVTNLADKRRQKESELPEFWPEASHIEFAKFGGDSHLYPFVGVESGVRTRRGVGKLLRLGSGVAQVLLDNERELVKDCPKTRPVYVMREFPTRDIYPSYVPVEKINEYRKSRRSGSR